MNEITKTESQLLFDFLKASAPVSNELFAEIIKLFKRRSYKKGDFILLEGEIEKYANVVMKGVVHQYIYDEGVPVTINITTKGLSFNDLESYLNKMPSREVHEAITDVELLYIARKDIDALALKNHGFSFLMFKIYERILLDRENRMLLLQYRKPSKRFILFHETVSRANGILKDTPDKYIASYLNMTPQQYSKEKKKMLKDKL